MAYRLYIDVNSEEDAVILQKVIHDSLWTQRALRHGKEDLTVHLVDLETIQRAGLPTSTVYRAHMDKTVWRNKEGE